MKTTRIAALVAAVALSLAACGGSPEPSDTVTVTQTSAWEAEQAAPAPAPAPAPEPSADIAEMALQITWDGLSAEDKESICFGYTNAPGMMLDSFVSGAGTDSQITRADAESFLDEQC